MKLDKNQKTAAAVAAGALVLYLLYRWYTNNQASSSTTGAVAPDTSSGDYASLAGQEQSDVAGLQGQITGLGAQIAGITPPGQSTQDQIDAALTGQTTGSDPSDPTAGPTETATDAPFFFPPGSADPLAPSTVSSIASGHTSVNRAAVGSIQTHKGGPFYNYYVKVTGKKPPATVRTSNFVYSAWKAGVKATALRSLTHPSSKNTQIAHPGHNAKPTVKPQPPKPPPKPATKPAAKSVTKPKTAPKPLPKPSKPKASGVRR